MLSALRADPLAGRRELAFGAGLVVVALLVGRLSVTGHRPAAVGLALLPALAWLLFRLRAAVILLAVSIPFPISIVGTGAGLNVAASDVLLCVVFFAVVAEVVFHRDRGTLRSVQPALVPMVLYLGWMLVLLVAHPGVIGVLQAGQRLELFLVPLVIGVAVARRGLEIPMMRAYLIIATLFAALYPFFSNGAGGLGAQKNPAGGFIAGALLLVIAFRHFQGRWLLTVPPLLLGLLWTQSRGSILSVVVGLAVLLIVHPGRERLRFVALMVPVAAVAIGAFALLPDEAQERNTSFETTKASGAGYALVIRERYRQEAWGIIRAEPVFGTGIGRYGDGAAEVRPTTGDPHQVLLFQAAEGGYPLAVGFVVLILGTTGYLFWRARHTPTGAAAAALLISTVGHGLVDVYWVRGTPVLSWLVVGVAVGQAGLRSRSEPLEDVEAPRRPEPELVEVR